MGSTTYYKTLCNAVGELFIPSNLWASLKAMGPQNNELKSNWGMAAPCRPERTLKSCADTMDLYGATTYCKHLNAVGKQFILPSNPWACLKAMGLQNNVIRSIWRMLCNKQTRGGAKESYSQPSLPQFLRFLNAVYQWITDVQSFNLMYVMSRYVVLSGHNEQKFIEYTVHFRKINY